MQAPALDYRTVAAAPFAARSPLYGAPRATLSGALPMQQKDCGFVNKIGQGEFPFLDGPGCDEFAGEGKVAGDTESCSFAAGGSDRLQQLLVAIRRFDEYLGLIAGY